jgi:hypothetical protein
MPRSAWMEIGEINISASPHPPGIYRAALEKAANNGVQIFGSDWAKLTPATEQEPGVLVGRVLVWTKIDKEGDWVNLEKNQKASDIDKKKIVLEPAIQPNYKSFQWAFIEKRHLMFIEYRNELRQGFGPKRVERFLSKIFSRDILGDDFPSIEITIIPEDDSLDRILAIDRLKRLKMVFKRPNPDDMGEDAEEILSAMMANGAGQQTIELVKARGMRSLTPDASTKKLAKVASINGFVSGEGRNGDEPVSESTKEHPKITIVKVPESSSFSAQFWSTIKQFL